MKKILALLLACFAASSFAQNLTSVIYVNGIQNTLADAQGTRDRIQEVLNASVNHQQDRRAFNVTVTWNRVGWDGTSDNSVGDGTLSEDKMELFLQKVAEENFSVNMARLTTPWNSSVSSIAKEDAQAVAAFIDDMTPGNNSLETSGKMNDARMAASQLTVNTLAQRMLDRSSAIVIAHSQGNLLANLAYARIASTLGSQTHSKYRIVNIANTSQFSINNLNLTHANDSAIFSEAGAGTSLQGMPGRGSNWTRTTPSCPDNGACDFNVGIPTLGNPTSPIPGQGITDKNLNHSIVLTYLSTATVPFNDLQGVVVTTNADRFVDRFEDFVYAAAMSLSSRPSANISIITPKPTAGNEVIFKAEVTATPNGAVNQFEWDFGDGTVQMQTGSEMFHTYTSGGTYTVKLKIKDEKGVTNLTEGSITVVAAPQPQPIPSLSINFDPGSQTLLGAQNYQAVEFVSGLNSRYAAKFGGVSKPGYIRIPNQEAMQFVDGATFDLYARIDSMIGMDGWGRTVTNGAYAMAFLAKSHDAAGVAFLANSMTDGNTSIWSASYDLSMSGGCEHVVNAPVTIGTWVRVTYTMSVTGGIYGYLDKKLAWKCPDARPNFSLMNQQDLYIGKFSDFWYPLNGAIQDIRIYKKALSASEIQTLQ